MKIEPLRVAGAFRLEPQVFTDDRGHFKRLFSTAEFSAAGLETSIAQINNSHTAKAGTIRGLHYQMQPFGEVKILNCLRGRIFDVIVDVSAASPTFGQWCGIELCGDDPFLVYAAKGCAHGFMSLTDNAEVVYSTSAPHSPPHERILRWDDPFCRIEWPREPTSLSAKDASARNFDPIGSAYHSG